MKECLLVIPNSKVQSHSHNTDVFYCFSLTVHQKHFPECFFVFFVDRASKTFSKLCPEFESAVLDVSTSGIPAQHWPHPKRAGPDQSEASICYRDRSRPIALQDFGLKWAEGRSGWMLASLLGFKTPPRSADD